MSRNKSRKIAIQLKNVTKTYELHHEKPTFVENVMRRGRKEMFTALKDIDLKIYKGEKVGIIGPNGAGKTTLLKLIAGITAPTEGEVKTRGKIVSLIDLEAGFHPDLTGEENVFLNGLLIGMSREEIKDRYREIVEFSGIGQFIDAPFYTYSQGMKLRLGFSVAVHVDPDILILDEGMMAGDQLFQNKTGKIIDSMFKANKTIVLVTHWLDFLKQNVKRILWFDNGRLCKDNRVRLINEYKRLLVKR